MIATDDAYAPTFCEPHGKLQNLPKQANVIRCRDVAWRRASLHDSVIAASLFAPSCRVLLKLDRPRWPATVNNVFVQLTSMSMPNLKYALFHDVCTKFYSKVCQLGHRCGKVIQNMARARSGRTIDTRARAALLLNTRWSRPRFRWHENGHDQYSHELECYEGIGLLIPFFPLDSGRMIHRDMGFLPV